MTFDFCLLASTSNDFVLSEDSPGTRELTNKIDLERPYEGT